MRPFIGVRGRVLVETLNGNARSVGACGVRQSFAEGQFGIIAQQAPVNGAQHIPVGAVLQHDPFGQQGFFNFDQFGRPDQCFAGPGSDVAAEGRHPQWRGNGAQLKPNSHCGYRCQPNSRARLVAGAETESGIAVMDHPGTLSGRGQQSSQKWERRS